MKKIVAYMVISLSLLASDLYVGIGRGSEVNSKDNSLKSNKTFSVEWDFYKHLKKSDMGLGCIVENNLQINNNPYSLFAAYGIYRFIDNSELSRPFLSLKAGYFPLTVTDQLFGLLYSSAGIGYNFKNKFEIELTYRILFGADTSLVYVSEDDSSTTENSDVYDNNSDETGVCNSKLLTLTLRKNFH